MKYGLGLILSLNAQNFRAGIRRSAQEMKAFGRHSELAMRRFERASSRVAGTTSALMGALSGLYVGVAAFQALTKQAKELDHQLRGLATVQKKTATEAQRFIDIIYKGNANLKEFTKATVAGAARQLAQAGYNLEQGAEGAKLLEASLNAVIASLGALNADQAIQLGINLEKGFGRGQRAATELFDIVGNAVNLFPLTMDKVQIALGYATSAAQTYNQSLESTMIAIGALMPVVATASKAGVAYRNTIAGLTKPFTAKFLQDEGIALRGPRGHMRDALEVLFDIDDALDETRAKDRKTGGAETETLIHRMFGIRGKALFTAIQMLPKTVKDMPALQGIQGLGNLSPREVYSLLQGVVADSGGSLQRMADDMRQSALVVDQRFNAQVANFAERLGMALLPIEVGIKNSIVDMLEGFGSLAKSMKSLASTIGFTKDTASGLARQFIYLGTYVVGLLIAKLTYSLGSMALAPLAGAFSLPANLLKGTPGAVAATGGFGQRALAAVGMGAFYGGQGRIPKGQPGGGQFAGLARTAGPQGASKFLARGSGLAPLLLSTGGIIAGIAVLGGILLAMKANSDHQLSIMRESMRADSEQLRIMKSQEERLKATPEKAVPDLLRMLGFGRALNKGDMVRIRRTRTEDFIQGFQKRFRGDKGFAKFRGDAEASFRGAAQEFFIAMGMTPEQIKAQQKPLSIALDKLLEGITEGQGRTPGAKKFQKDIRDRILSGVMSLVTGSATHGTSRGAFETGFTVGGERRGKGSLSFLNLTGTAGKKFGPLAAFVQEGIELRQALQTGKITPQEFGTRKTALLQRSLAFDEKTKSFGFGFGREFEAALEVEAFSPLKKFLDQQVKSGDIKDMPEGISELLMLLVGHKAFNIPLKYKHQAATRALSYREGYTNVIPGSDDAQRKGMTPLDLFIDAAATGTDHRAQQVLTGKTPELFKFLTGEGYGETAGRIVLTRQDQAQLEELKSAYAKAAEMIAEKLGEKIDKLTPLEREQRIQTQLKINLFDITD